MNDQRYNDLKPTPAGAPAAPFSGSILVVDDSEDIRRLISIYLQLQGHQVREARNGREALHLLERHTFDLVLLDMMMPEVTGQEVLEFIKNSPALLHLPVVVISAANELRTVVQCIELGAEDFLPKPFEPAILFARVNASLERKRLRDREQAYLQSLEDERVKAERLLLNVLPKPIAERLLNERRVIVDRFAEVTVLFIDIVNFTDVAARVGPEEMVEWLNDVFSTFDELAARYGLEKIKTIGDAYMVAAGLPVQRPDHAAAAAIMALNIRALASRMTTPDGEPLQLRLGMHSGPVIAGVIGATKFSYDLWGDTVNTASRMESHSLPNHIQTTAAVYQLLCDQFTFEPRGLITIKSKGEMPTYWLTGMHSNGQ
jgi:class 3 adenylate cyclase